VAVAAVAVAAVVVAEVVVAEMVVAEGVVAKGIVVFPVLPPAGPVVPFRRLRGDPVGPQNAHRPET